jgi:hypothetical protein
MKAGQGISTTNFLALPSKPQTKERFKGMKVKFLKKGRWAHRDVSRGQFEFDVGQEMDGISEADAQMMVESETAEIIGPDDEKSDESDDGSESSNGDGDDSGGQSEEKGSGKPW